MAAQGRPDKRILLSLVWFLLIEPFWTSDLEQQLLQDEVAIRYPKISSNETIECDCRNITCDSVFWFRNHFNGKPELLGRCNNADRVTYGENIDPKHFKFSKKGSNSFMLRVINVTEDDKGIYSCIGKKNHAEIWKPGTLLLPGETPPTPTPKPKVRQTGKKKSKSCPCKSDNAKDKCGYMILWPLVGLLAGLALILVCTLRYFSQLPRKCHHHFVKRSR